MRQRRRRRSCGAGRGCGPEDAAHGAAVAAARRRARAGRPGALRFRLQRRVRPLRLADAAVRRGPRLARPGQAARKTGCRRQRNRRRPPTPLRRLQPRRNPPNRSPPPSRPNPHRAKTIMAATVCGPARWWRASGSRPSWTPTASTGRRPTSGSCWSPPAGGSGNGSGGDFPPAGVVRGTGSAGSLDAAGDAGRAARAASLARLRRGERALCQCRQHGIRRRVAAIRRHRCRDPGGAGRHARRRRARALHGPGDPLGEPALRGGEPGLGRTARRCRRGARTDGPGTPRPAGARRLAAAAQRGTALHPLGLPGVRHRLPHGRTGSRGRDRARRFPPRARRNAGIGWRDDPAAGAGRAALIGRRTHGPRHGRLPRRRNRAPAAPLGAARAAARTVYRSRTGAQRRPDRPHLPQPGRRGRHVRRGHRRSGAVRHRLPGSVAGLARQCADRRLPPRLPATGLPGVDLPYRRDRRRGGRREGVPQIRPRDATGRHRHRQVSPRPAREGARLAGGHRPDQGRREAGPGLLHGGGLRPIGCSGRGRAGGPRDLPRPGLAGERRALHAAPLLAGLPPHGVRRRARRRPRTHGPDEDAAHVERPSTWRRCTANGGASPPTRKTRPRCS